MKYPHLDVQLIADHDSVTTGTSFKTGVYFHLEKGWHVYWQNPGDSGEPPQIKWNLAEGVHAGSILWPTPKQIQVGPLLNYGYEDEILLPIPIELSPQYSRQQVALKADVGWLVCNNELCVPGKAPLSLELPLKPEGKLSHWASLFEATEKTIPTPAPSSWRISGALTADSFHLSLSGLPAHFSNVVFFPIAADEVDNSQKINVASHENSVQIDMKRSDRMVKDVNHLPALVVFKDATGVTQSAQMDFPLNMPAPVAPAPDLSLIFMLFAAFAGGLLLNLMPCVFPVLSLKVISIVRMSGEERSSIRKMGIAYTLGILVSFWSLVGLLVALRLGGEKIGWGFQLQSPRFVLVLASVLFAFGLNLLGMFEISGSFMGAGSSLAGRKGLVGSFFTGVLATLVATPCSAPFMGSAVGFAITQSPIVVFVVFTSLALGLACPYLLVSYIPALGRLLPKPGIWMETFKELMSFLIFGTVVWLAWVLMLQTSSSGVVILLSSFLGIGFCAWFAHRKQPSSSAQMSALLMGVMVITLSAYELKQAPAAAETGVSHAAGLSWEKFSPEKLAEYREKGQPVFLDFTAAWCVSCQVNELVVFHSEEVKQKLRDLGIVLMKGDWTNEDPVITQTLASFGRNGVPFYVLYGRGKNSPAMPLPEIINAGIVLKELEKIK